MKRYNHNYNDGDIVTDTKYNEVFHFTDKTDGSRAEQSPGELRLATPEEKQALIDSGKDCLVLSVQSAPILEEPTASYCRCECEMPSIDGRNGLCGKCERPIIV